MTCERCQKETTSFSMSYFDTDMICPDCEEKEKAHPKYAEAYEAECEAVARMDFLFPGIGKPEDL